MKKIFLFCIILIVLLSFGSLYGDVVVTDLNSYDEWNIATKKIVREQFDNNFPNVEFARKYCRDYYYSYKQAFLGDQNFIIYANFEIPDKNDYKSKIKTFDKFESLFYNNDSEMYIFLQGDEKDMSLYLDDELLDGMFYDFEIIVANNNSQTIHYLIAHVWDYHRDEKLFDFLEFVQLGTVL